MDSGKERGHLFEVLERWITSDGHCGGGGAWGYGYTRQRPKEHVGHRAVFLRSRPSPRSGVCGQLSTRTLRSSKNHSSGVSLDFLLSPWGVSWANSDPRGLEQFVGRGETAEGGADFPTNLAEKDLSEK